MGEQRKKSPLRHCREPRHQELFLAVVQTTQARSSERRQEAERAAGLEALFERHKRLLDSLPGGR